MLSERHLTGNLGVEISCQVFGGRKLALKFGNHSAWLLAGNN